MQNPVPNAPASPTLIHRLTSIIQRLEPASMFPVAQPLEVELGSGDGSFLVNFAKLHPGRNFMGVERLLGRLRKSRSPSPAAPASKMSPDCASSPPIFWNISCRPNPSPRCTSIFPTRGPSASTAKTVSSTPGSPSLPIKYSRPKASFISARTTKIISIKWRQCLRGEHHLWVLRKRPMN